MRTLAYIIIAGLLLLAFDRMMREDAKNLCSNDATAYDECEWQSNR